MNKGPPTNTNTTPSSTPTTSQCADRPGIPYNPRSFQPNTITLPRSRCPLHRRFLSHLSEPIPASLSSAFLLLILTIMTGIQDATTFPDYHCFASNQTGNTIFLTLAVIIPELNGKMFVTANIGVALALFLVGGWLTGQLGHVIAPAQNTRHGIGGRQRWYLILCNLVQTILVFVAAGIQFRYGVALSSSSDLVAIGLLAFASGSQVVQSRSLAMTEISTAMATAAWVDLMIDPHLLSFSVSIAGSKDKRRGRNRRLAFLTALVSGGFVGAALYRWMGSEWAILVSAVGKGFVVVGWMVVPGERVQDGHAREGEGEGKGEESGRGKQGVEEV